ncbi:MAG: hypothetical protein JHD02_00155 [Thermoleophilaceae bacterium]|nr:hypothetical protein [Thermoleophilaceae bacterium]
MNTRILNIPKTLLLAFALAGGILVLLQSSRSAPALATPGPSASTPASTRSAPNNTRLVTVLLTSNSFTARLPERATDLLTTTKGTTAARLAAQRNPFKRSGSEAVAASIAEHARNAALPLIREAAAPDLAASQALQRKIRRLGGRIVSASPIPNQIVMRIDASAIPSLKRDPRVASVTAAKLPVSLAGPIDGSAIWWANGFTGQGPSLDGNGSPDAVVFDTGIRVNHNYFKSRLLGDCSTCQGSGPTRVTSPVIRSDFSGSKHGNTIGATIAATSFSGGPNPTSGVGMAYGIDKLYDNYQATNPYLWDLGINVGSDTGLGGNTDLPEVINYSATIYQNTVDLDPAWNYFDALESRFGILNTIGGGNCGIADPFYTNCATGPHRIGTPGVNYNVLTMGGQDPGADPTNTATYAPWPNSSPGPTWGGRKKPDMIGPVSGIAGTPSAIDDVSTTSFGQGTSFAAPVAAAGALLLGSAGVYLPTAQKAIMINSARPVQGQTYWTPRTGWGAINMDAAYYDRGNYVNGNVSGSGANSARFFQVTGVASDDRATLVWNRRTSLDNITNPDNLQITNPAYYNLTDLDLTQFDPGTLTATSTGGSDAADTVDTDQTITAANPMPGNGSDGGDNVEQIRSTGTGTQILKVKALSSVDGTPAEPYSLATTNPITALSTPIPTVALATVPSVQGVGQNVTVTATVQNPSNDLPLASSSVLLTLPAGTTLITGANPAPLGTIAPNGTTIATWTLQGNTAGPKNLSADISGTAYGENFAGNDTDSFQVDGTPPVVSITPTPAYSTTTNPAFTWSATDSQSTVANYDVETALDAGPWTPALTNTTLTTTIASGGEGQVVHLRVRSRDTFGNESGWSEVSTTIDAAPPIIAFGSSQTPSSGTINVPVTYSNVGSPVTSAVYSFAPTAGTPNKPLTAAPATYFNTTRSVVTATLLVTVTDAAGHTATKAQAYSVAQTTIAANLQIAKPKIKSRTATIKGTINSSAAGKVTLTVRRKGKTGTRKVTKRAAIKSGRYSAKVKLKKGKYTVSASFTGSPGVTTANTKRSFTVR